LNTELAMTKVPFAAAYQVTPKLSIGLAALVFHGRLAISPNPVNEPDISGSLTDGTFKSIRPMVGGFVTEFGLGAQIGIYYEFSPMISAGASFTTPQNFDFYEWNSVHGNPDLDNYLTARKVDIDIDGPPVLSIGIGLNPTSKLKIALDGRWIGYEKTTGIGVPPKEVYGGTKYEGKGGGITPVDESGVGPRGPLPRNTLVSIGWKNILIGMLGAEYQAHPKVTVRGGLNLNQAPIKKSIVLNSGGTPSVFTQHYTGGFSVALTEDFSMDTGFYYTPKNTIEGPFLPIEGAKISLTDGIASVLIGFSAKF
jgi:long-chain fatty acid transport protein